MIEELAKQSLHIYPSLNYIQVYLALAGFPALILFVFHRFRQLRDVRFEMRPTTPTHTVLHFLCAVLYGLLLPMLYLVNSHRPVAWFLMWRTASFSNSPLLGPLAWPLMLGFFLWLSVHLLEALARRGRPSFGPHWLNQVVNGIASLFFLFIMGRIVYTLYLAPPFKYWESSWLHALYKMGEFFHTQMGLLGAFLVYFLAFLESVNKNAIRTTADRRRWRLALVIQTVILILFVSPLWLSIPRVTHRQALHLLVEHQMEIVETAQKAELDPALLAGIIYVAQTRDHPRLTGGIHEKFCLAIWKETANSGPESPYSPAFRKRFNASAGLCQIRPGTAEQVLVLVKNRMRSSTNSPNSIPEKSRPIYEDFLVYKYEIEEVNHLGLLLNPQKNLVIAATILSILDDDWQDAGYSLSEKPEILATLYNLGFGKSDPKADPRPNDFGERVANFMATKECRNLFKVDTIPNKTDNSN